MPDVGLSEDENPGSVPTNHPKIWEVLGFNGADPLCVGKASLKPCEEAMAGAVSRCWAAAVPCWLLKS